jgi:hypothetical protein
MVAASELPIDTGASATDMANEIFGDGVTVINASYTGDNRSSGTYSDGDAVSGEVTPGDTGVMLSTGRLSSFTNRNGNANQSSSTSRNTNGVDNDSDFNALAGTNTYDAAILDVDFIPPGDTMSMQFVFASDEYPEYTNSVYQDAVGVWINGVEVPLAVGNGDSDPGNINSTNNQNLYNDNTSSQFNTEMDGFTVTMTLTIPVYDGVLNSIRIGIADVSDSSYDSTLIIAGGSVQTAVIAHDDSTHLTANQTKTIDVLGNDTSAGSLTVTHINNVAVVVGTTVTLTTGQTATLNADGSITLVGDGTNEDFTFTYGIDDGTNADTGIVTVSSVPCFVAGTLIRTPNGDFPVEDLQVGDLVETYDDGPQPLRWVGTRTVPATGDFAPIRIAPNTLGHHDELLVSPLHRVLIRDCVAELLFGESEVLVAAKDLVNDRTIRRVSGGDVNYLHLLFDRHQIVFSEGLATESFLPGPQTKNCLEAEVAAEIYALFPEIDPESGEGYSPAARRTLKRFEAELLAQEAQVA